MSNLTRRWSRQLLAGSMLLLVASCGTRVGNPKKPDDGTKQAVVIPKLNLTLLKDEEAAELALQAPTTDLASNSVGVFRLDIVIASLNALIDNLNGAELPLGEVFQKDLAKGSLVAQVTEVTDATYKYQGVFCANGAPFYYARWSEDGNEIESVRDFSVNPFTDDDKALEAGSELLAEVTYRGGGAALDSFLNGTPADKDLLAGEQTYLMDYVRLERDEDRFKYKGAGYWSKPDADRSNIEPQRYIAGRLDADGQLTVLVNDARLKFCTPFDATNVDAPNWCFGYSQYPPKGVPSILLKDDVDAFWDEIKGVGLVTAAEVKVVTFPAGAVCPVP